MNEEMESTDTVVLPISAGYSAIYGRQQHVGMWPTVVTVGSWLSESQWFEGTVI
jgi:hypothetical protein